MIVATYIYAETYGTRQMAKSVKALGYELAPVKTTQAPDNINRELILLYERACSVHDTFIYADAADTYFQAPVTIPTDYLLYSTEKACYPHPSWASKFPEGGRWRFLNGGGVCGPTKLMLEYHKRYNLIGMGSKNGQQYLQEIYFQARADGFPVRLDTKCEVFQSIAFAEEDEFSLDGPLLVNKITGTIPSVIHGNGLTPMKHIYERFEKQEV